MVVSANLVDVLFPKLSFLRVKNLKQPSTMRGVILRLELNSTIFCATTQVAHQY
jgi:hypothetical protein